MKYYKLSMDMERKNDIICNFEKKDINIQQNAFNIGKKYDVLNNEICFLYDKSEGYIATDYLANDKGWFIISSKLKKLVEILNSEIQFIPVKIIEKSEQKELKGYYIANIIRVVNALCLEESEYFETEIPGIGAIYTVSKYAIFENRINNSDVFKLSNRQEIPIFVSEKFKKLMENNIMTGMSLREIRVR